jgi:8-oxo-dGTP diphosphatase
MKQRKTSRILVLDENNRVLLIHFVHKKRAPGRNSYWATPGGEIEEGETIAQAAKRELYEETGLSVDIDTLGKPVWHNEFIFRADDGIEFLAHENFFVVCVPSSMIKLSRANWTEQEHEVIAEFKWWSVDGLRITTEIFYPENLVTLLDDVVKS